MASAEGCRARAYGTPATPGSSCDGLRHLSVGTTKRGARHSHRRAMSWLAFLLLLGHGIPLAEPAICTTATYSIGTDANLLGTALGAITGALIVSLSCTPQTIARPVT